MAISRGEVGVPVGLLPELRDGFRVRLGQDGTDQVGDLLLGEWAQHEALDQIARGRGAEDLEQRWVPPPGWIPVADDDQQTCRGPIDQMPQQQRAGPVDAVSVLDDEQDRSGESEPTDDPLDRVVERQAVVLTRRETAVVRRAVWRPPPAVSRRVRPLRARPREPQ